jgi:hypothetical protein
MIDYFLFYDELVKNSKRNGKVKKLQVEAPWQQAAGTSAVMNSVYLSRSARRASFV